MNRAEVLARRQEIINGLRTTYGTSQEDAERAADRTLKITIEPAYGVDGEPSVTTVTTVDGKRLVDHDEIGRLEKDIEHAGDKLMVAVGFEVIKFSHPGKTKQTPGISDRRYYRRPRVIRTGAGNQYVRALVAWFEAKTPEGRQRPDQRAFQELVEACGETYLLGGLAVLRTWLAGQGVCTFGVDNLPIPLPLEDQVR